MEGRTGRHIEAESHDTNIFTPNIYSIGYLCMYIYMYIYTMYVIYVRQKDRDDLDEKERRHPKDDSKLIR